MVLAVAELGREGFGRIDLEDHKVMCNINIAMVVVGNLGIRVVANLGQLTAVDSD